MTQPQCDSLFERIFPFWSTLTDMQRQGLCRHTVENVFTQGDNIHGGRGECTGAIVLKSGCIRAYLLSEQGKEITLYRLNPGEICMLSASCVLAAITFDVFVDAEEDSVCYIIGGNAFAALTHENVYAENYALNVAVQRFSDVVWVLQKILFLSLDKRLAIFLYEEACKTDGELIRLSQEKIATYMGSAREVVSRMLKYFAAEGIAKAVRGGVQILNREKLCKLATD